MSTSTCLSIVRQQADHRAVGGRDQLPRVLGSRRRRALLLRTPRWPGSNAALPSRRGRMQALPDLRQRQRVGGDIGPRFVDDADDAERQGNADWMRSADFELADFADGVGQRRDFAHHLGPCRDARRFQRQPIDERRITYPRACRRHVLRVGGQRLFGRERWPARLPPVRHFLPPSVRAPGRAMRRARAHPPRACTRASPDRER